MKKRLVGFLLCLVPAIAVLSQNNVGIGTITPNASAILDVNSSTKGLLVPRMTAVQRLAINPATNAKTLMVFDTDSSAFFFWTGTVWSRLLSSGGTYQWLTNGNSIYNNNSGNVGIGNSNPQYKLEVSGRVQLRGSIDYNNSAGLWLGGAGADSAVRKIFIGMRADSSAGFYSEIFDVGWGLVFDGRSCNVGIGNPDPSFPISFRDWSGYKISLYREGSNYYGLGIGNASMQLMTPHNTSDILLGYGRSAAFTENMRIKGNGIVGIGESNPILGGLVVNKKVGATHAVFGSNTTGVAIESSFPGIGFNTYFDGTRKTIAAGYSGYIGVNPVSGGMQLLVSGSSVNAGSSPALNPGIEITPNGYVGIGTSSSNAPLQLSNGTVNRKIVLYDVNNNDHQFYGLCINAGTLRYQTSGIDADHVFFSGSTSTTSQELMRIKGNGNVGIGISDPAYKLDVGARMRIRATPGFTAGHWLNNDANNASPAFIGMFSDSQVGFYGSGPAGRGLLMNTQTGAVSFGGNAGQLGQVLTSNGSSGSPSWVPAGAVINTAFSGSTLAIRLTGTTIRDLTNSAFTIAVSVPSRIMLQYKITTAKSCVAGNCATKWGLSVYQNDVYFTDYKIDGVSYGGPLSAEFSSSTVGPDYFDVQPGSYTFSFKARNIFNEPTVGEFKVYSTTVAR